MEIILKEVLYRGQTGRFGEKLIAGEPLSSNWVYGGVCTPPGIKGDFSIIYGTGDAYRDDKTGIACEKYIVYRDTIGQYLWKTDKNGIKIFEHDIVTASHGYRGVVELERFIYTAYNGDIADDIQVIGNIHDNLELWEKFKVKE